MAVVPGVGRDVGGDALADLRRERRALEASCDVRGGARLRGRHGAGHAGTASSGARASPPSTTARIRLRDGVGVMHQRLDPCRRGVRPLVRADQRQVDEDVRGGPVRRGLEEQRRDPEVRGGVLVGAAGERVRDAERVDAPLDALERHLRGNLRRLADLAVAELLVRERLARELQRDRTRRVGGGILVREAQQLVRERSSRRGRGLAQLGVVGVLRAALGQLGDHLDEGRTERGGDRRRAPAARHGVSRRESLGELAERQVAEGWGCLHARDYAGARPSDGRAEADARGTGTRIRFRLVTDSQERTGSASSGHRAGVEGPSRVGLRPEPIDVYGPAAANTRRRVLPFHPP